MSANRLWSVPCRGAVILLLVALAGAVAGARPARAGTVERWSTPAPRLVDPADRLQAGAMVTDVLLPEGYRGRRCWPVLYLLHGTQAGSRPAAGQWLTLAGGALRRLDIPAIVVIPGSGDSWFINDWFGGQRAPAFETWMERDIVPLARRRLHICPGRSEHSIAGLSMGGYGAIYLASQLPGYFGSAGSFSAPLSPQSPNFRRYIYPPSADYWGPAGRFYAVGHDPLALVANLRHTRVFVGVGNGRRLPGETDIPSLSTEETEYEQESIAFVRRARAAGVPVDFDPHGGQHTDLTWLRSLRDMLAWGPFRHVPAAPRDWTFSTVATTGSAWGDRFAFGAGQPTGIVQFARRGRTLTARGSGTVTITTAAGRRVSGTLPFDVRDGRLIPTPGAPAPSLRGGDAHVAAVAVSPSPGAPGESTPIGLTFTPSRPLPPGEEYQVGRISLSDTTGSCDDNVWQRVGALPAGQAATETLAPPVTATFPGRWCSGPAVFAVSAVPTGAPPTVPGTILGVARVTIQG
jgi:S-formylglutathione hydrolase FrmB